MALIPLTSSSLDLTISIPGSSGESDDGRAMRNLDINQVPVDGDDDRKWMMTLSLNSIRNSSADMEEDHDDGEGGGGSSPPRKKLRLSKEQSRSLEESFRRNQTLNPKQKEELAMQLKLKARQVEVWFQNRRARSKLKQTEMECEYLKRWFGSLTERNRRLQKEVEQLRAMKAAPSSSGAFPNSNLTMCPRCERITAATTTTTDMSAGKLPARSNNLLPATTRQHSSAAC